MYSYNNVDNDSSSSGDAAAAADVNDNDNDDDTTTATTTSTISYIGRHTNEIFCQFSYLINVINARRCTMCSLVPTAWLCTQWYC